MSELRVHDLPVGSEEGTAPVALWGTWLFIATEATLFAAFLASYFYVRFRSPEWPQGGAEPPELALPLLGTAILLSSSATAHWAERGIGRGARRRLTAGLAATVLLGVAFLGVQAYEYAVAHLSPSDSAYASFFFGITGFHGLHVAVGIAMLLAVGTVAWTSDRYTPDRHLPVRLAVLYWHFVDVVWLFVFSSLYLLEHV